MSKQTKQVRQALNNFYQQPVARVSLELFLSVGAIIFFALFAIRPTMITMSDLFREIEEKQTIDRMLSNKVAALATAQVEYLQLKDRLTLLDQAIPNQEDLLLTLKTIEKIASNNPQIAITSITTAAADANANRQQPESTTSAKKDKKQNFLLEIEVVGNYPAIKQFLVDLSQSRRTLIIDSVFFSTQRQRTQERLQARISVKAPYYSEGN